MEFKICMLLLGLGVAFPDATAGGSTTSERVIVLTGIEADPDDTQSLVHRHADVPRPELGTDP